MREHESRAKTRWLALLLALTLVRGLFYVAVIPPWQAPDETGHFEYAWLIAEIHRLPTREDASPAFERELLGSLYEWRYGELIGRPLPESMPSRLDDLPTEIHALRSRTVKTERFSLNYLWQALFLLPVRFQDLAVQLRIARFSSVLLNVAIVGLAFKTFSELVPAHPYLVYAMTAVVVFLPQHTFINSTVGDGPLAELAACLVLYCWVLLFCRGIGVWAVLGIVLGTLAGILSKVTAAFLVPLDIGLGLWWCFRRTGQAWTWQRAAYVGIGLALLAILTWAWFRSPLSVHMPSTIQGSLPAADLLWEDRRGVTLGEALLGSHDSFWANFGWMTVPVSSRWYGALLTLTGAAALGWVLGGKVRDVYPRWAPTMMGTAFLLALAIFVWTGLLAQTSGFYQYQGRYLFTAIIPFAFLLVGGWMRIMPPGRRKILIGSAIAFLVLFDAWSVMAYMIPYFYSG